MADPTDIPDPSGFRGDAGAAPGSNVPDPWATGYTAPTTDTSTPSGSTADSSKVGVSTSKSGLPGGFATTQKLGGFGGVDAKVNAAMGPLGVQKNALSENLQNDYSTIAGAVGEYHKAEAAHFERTRALQERIADFYDTAGKLETQMAARGQAERQKYVADIQSQLGGVRELMAQNANPLAGVSPGRGFALGMAAFAQGMLATRGVQIDVAGQVDHWVDREIQQHQLAIQNARAGVQDTLSLYNIARQSSQDDWEARQKMRAFTIEGFKARLEVEGDRFQSEIAATRAKEQIARLDIELNSTLDGLGDRYYKNWLDTHKSLADEAYHQGMLMIEKERNSIQAAEMNRKALADAAKAKQEYQASVIYDTSKGGKGMARWEWLPGTADQEKQKYRETQAGAAHLDQLVDEYRGMVRQYKNVGAADKTRWASDNDARMRAIQGEIVELRALALTGKAASDAERKQIESATPIGLFTGTTKIEPIVAQTQKHMIDQLDQTRMQLARPLQQGDERTKWQVAPDHFNEQGYADAKNTAESGGDISPTTRGEAHKAITSEGSEKPANDEQLTKLGVEDGAKDGGAKDYWGSYVGDVAASYRKMSKEQQYAEVNHPGGQRDALNYYDAKSGTAEVKEVPNYAAGIVSLAKLAKTEGPARKQLAEIANIDLGASSNESVDVEKRNFARYMAKQYGVDLSSEPTEFRTPRTPEQIIRNQGTPGGTVTKNPWPKAAGTE